MKPSAITKLKFKQLQRRLRLCHWQTVGVLESIWRVTEANCPEGDIGRLTNEEIAAAIEWEGDADDLVAALIECRWLDADDHFRLVVHDWSVHCPNHVKGAMAKHKRHFADEVAKHRARQNTEQDARQAANSTVPPFLSSPFLSSPTLRGDDATAHANGSSDGRPARVPNGEQDAGAAGQATDEATGYPEEFEAFWSAYPTRGGRKRGKRKCLGIWRQAIRQTERQPLVEAARNYAASDESTRGYARDPERFLRAEWWRDWVPTLATLPPPPPAPVPDVPARITPAKWS